MWRELKSVMRVYARHLPQIIWDVVTSASLTDVARKYPLIRPIPLEGWTTRFGTRFPSGPEAQRGTLYRWRDRHGVEVWRIVGPNGAHQKLPPGVGPHLYKIQHRLLVMNRSALGLVLGLLLASVVGAILWLVL